MSRAPLAAFLLSLVGVGFVLGYATDRFHIFPYSILKRAEAGMASLYRLESTAYPIQFIAFEPAESLPGPVHLLAPPQSDDLILLTGGWNYRTDLCPDAGCIAWIMDREGHVLHRWSYPPEEFLTESDLKEFRFFKGFFEPDNVYVQGVELAPNGDIVVTFQGRNIFPYQVGIARFDRDGNLLWKRIDQSHHWPAIAADGTIATPVATIERPPGKWVAGTAQENECGPPQNAVYQEGIRLLRPDGSEVATFMMDDIVRQFDARGLAYSVRDDCDPFHVNGVDFLNAAAAARIDGAREGDLLVSLRSSSALVVLSRKDGRILSIETGPMVAQHSPKVLPDGSVLVFDNLGGDRLRGGARVLQLDLGSQWARTVFPPPGAAADVRLESVARGVLGISADGTRALVSESLGGRVLEIDIASGRLLWSYDEIDDISAYLDARGTPYDSPMARLQTDGARYVEREMFERVFAGPS